MATALITGVSGQDGAYLADALVRRGNRVVGLSRTPTAARLGHLADLAISDSVTLLSQPTDGIGVRALLDEIAPDEIYHLSGQSSVGISFHEPASTIASLVDPTLALCEALRLSRSQTPLICAGSGDCFGDTGHEPADEHTPVRPNNPYAVGKATARWTVSTYRSAYHLRAATAILFNHESPLRGHRFVTAKIAAGAHRIAQEIAAGSNPQPLQLGNLEIERDWGWAPEYVEAIMRMAQLPQPEDLIIATGKPCSLRVFTEAAFEEVGLDWKEHVQSDPTLLRPTDARRNAGDPCRAHDLLGWRATTAGPEVARRLARSLAAS